MMKSKIIGIISVLVIAIMLAACGSTPQDVQPEVIQEETTDEYTMTEESYAKGLEAIDIMNEYLAGSSGDEAIQKFEAIQAEINDQNDFVWTFMNVFISDIQIDFEHDGVLDQIKVFQEELERRKP